MKNVASVVKVDDVVRVRVMSVDASSGRIALSMKGMSGRAQRNGPGSGQAIRVQLQGCELGLCWIYGLLLLCTAFMFQSVHAFTS